MDRLSDLKDLLRHEVEDLYSAEEQIIKALPLMIEKARHPQLRAALQEHLEVTTVQLQRLVDLQPMLADADKNASQRSKGFFSKFFGGSGTQHCKGMEGLITEGQKVMNEDMDPDVMDAAIIASAQKIEHYEICGYGTARAYARELNLKDAEALLTQTLNEEYEADDLLTALAVGKGLNRRAESSGGRGARKKARPAAAKKSATKRRAGTGSKSGGGARKKSGAKVASGGRGAVKTGRAKGKNSASSRAGGRSAAKKRGAKAGTKSSRR